MYGTSKKAVEDIADKGQICILDIEMEVRYIPLGSRIVYVAG